MICRLHRNLRFVREHFIATSLSIFLVLFSLVSASALAASVQKSTNSNPCNLSEDELQGLSHDVSREGTALEVYIDTISSMLHQERFDALDCLSDRARANKERFPGGHWKIHELYQGLYEPLPEKHATDEDWQDLMKLLEHWVQAHPKSVTARVALASAWIGYAGQARGDGYSDTVSEKGWKLYEQRTAEAEQVLEGAAALPAKCPEFYAVEFDIAKNQSWEIERIHELFDDASAFEPGYYYYGRALAMLLEPKWFGQSGDTAKFVQQAADRIGGKEGDAYYFLVASSKNVLCGCEDQPKLSLERIERGYQAVEALYGVSMFNLNRLAYLTLHLGKTDILLADQTFERIGDQWTKYSWGEEKVFEQSKNWAHQMVPAVKENSAREEDALANFKTPEGARYQVGFDKAYKEMVRDCVHSDGAGVAQWEGSLESLILLGANGYVEDVRLNDMGPVVACMYKRMHASYEQKSPLFPVPPKDSFWVRVDLNWEDFDPATAKR